MYEFARPNAGHPELSVPPKRILAERLLRSVEARSVNRVPKCSLRLVEVLSVIASGSRPCSFASRREGPLENPRSMLGRMFCHLKRAAQANRFQRLAERFSSSSPRPLRQVESVASVSRPVASRLN